MNNMADLELKANESKYLTFTIKDANDEVFDLTDTLSTIQLQKYGQSTLIVNEGCAIVSAINGTCKWLYRGALNAGMYRAEIEITFSGGLKYITPTFDIEIIASLPE
jgi:hypothetical protein